ncbi:MAG: DNA replication protein [Alphaproteobacteria bacterium]|nr:DNA replication protein [Alphaproteobacteria bacterium]
MKQLILPFSVSPTFEARNFIVSSANEEAYRWVLRWPNWTGICLAIYGEQGCGKTHLSHIWHAQTQAVRLTSEEFNQIDLVSLLKGPRHIILEDAQLIERDEKLFHFYNHIALSNGGLLILSRTPPARWKSHLPDLQSRLNAIPAIKIHDPDEKLLSYVFQKLFHDLQLKVDESVITFLLKHMVRSFESARKWVKDLNVYALTQNRSITIPLVRELLKQKEEADRSQ